MTPESTSPEDAARHGGSLPSERLGLSTQLRREARGWVEWRVQDPVSKSYCMVYSSYGGDAVLNPEHEAREWLRKHISEFPGGRFVGYEVARVEVQSRSDHLMRAAAVELDKLTEALDHIASGQLGAILCIRTARRALGRPDE